MTQSLEHQLRTYANPHVARLMRQPGPLNKRSTRISCLNLMIACTLWFLGATSFLPEWGYGMATIALFTAAVPLMIVIPLIAIVIGTNTIATDTKAQSFEILKTTTLSNWQLVWGYVWSLILRLQTLYVVLIGTWIAIISTTFVSLVLLEANGYNPTYNVRVTLLILTLAIQNVGLNLLLLFLPIALAIHYSDTVSLNIMLPLFSFGLTFAVPLVTVFLSPDLNAVETDGLRLNNTGGVVLPMTALLTYIGWAVLPWVLAALAALVANRGVRHA